MTAQQESPIVLRQLTALHRRWPDAHLVRKGPNELYVRLSIVLPGGWSRPSVGVLFRVPVGYPSAMPAGFWTTSVVSRAGARGTLSYATGRSVPPGYKSKMLEWRWRTHDWNPNVHTLETFVNVIRRRFALTY